MRQLYRSCCAVSHLSINQISINQLQHGHFESTLRGGQRVLSPALRTPRDCRHNCRRSRQHQNGHASRAEEVERWYVCLAYCGDHQSYLGHGSQCGFCTPGFVMSMYALLRNTESPTMSQIDHALYGNLCRCTGYRPILESFYTFTKDGERIDFGF